MKKKTTVSRKSMTQTDSKGRVTRAPRDNSAAEEQNFRWWTLDEKDVAASVRATIQFLQHQQTARIEQLVSSTRLYGNSTSYNIFGSALSRSGGGQSTPMNQRISYNLCQSVIDTLIAKMAKNKVIPTYITNGGIWNVQKKAKQLTKFTQGWFYGEKVHHKAIDAFGDGAVWGDGFVHVLRENDKAVIERTLPHELWADEIETLTGKPFQLFRARLIDRDRAYVKWPELSDDIEKVEIASYQDMGAQGSIADLIVVEEAWHLRSGPDEEDGAHAICIGDGTLMKRYDKDYFPFPHFRYSKRKIGWNGQGACERLQNIQSEINRGMILKQRSLWMMASFKLLVENSSKIVDQHLNNDVGTIVRYSNTKPEYVTPPATNPELQQWIDSLIMKGYQQEGVSELSAQGAAPLGVESGKALRTLTQIADDRFEFVGQEMESFQLEIARQGIEVMRDIHKDGKPVQVTFPSTRFLQTIDWSDIQLEEDQYVLKAYPTSSLSDDLTGRLSEVQEMVQAGMISPRTSKRMMGMPDVEIEDALSNAAEDRLHQIFEDMLDDGKFTAPEAPFHDLQLAKQLLLEYYNYAEYMKAPDSRLALLQRFNSALNDALGILNPQPLQGGTPIVQPQAAPQPTPQSNLIPNVASVGAA